MPAYICSMLLEDIVATSITVKSTRSRLAKTDALAALLHQMRPDEVEIGVTYLSGEPRQNKTGLGYAVVGRTEAAARAEAVLTIAGVDGALQVISEMSGTGSKNDRIEAWTALLEAATAPEQQFLRGLVLRNLRQGALEGIVVEAVAKAADVSVGEVRRALMVSGDLGAVAASALTGGADALQTFRLTLFRPVQPMLAQTAEDVAAAIEKTGRAAVEAKIDGARIQVHRSGSEVRAYTRNLKEVTGRIPEIVELVAALRVESLILDGEVIALRRDGRPEPFQVTMSRFGTKRNVGASPAPIRLSVFFFDCIYLDGVDLLEAPGVERLAALRQALTTELIIDRIETKDPEEAAAFYEGVLARGHEGVVVKALDAPYESGRRGASWIKVKPAHTLDLVVLAVEWGSGRRTGWLSNLHLGARQPEGGFVMLGKTFKGLTDEMLKWQTERFLGLKTHQEGHVVHVRPEQVVEIAFDGVQGSTRYPGGMALRFARVKGYRPDKSAHEADTIDTVRAIFEQ